MTVDGHAFIGLLAQLPAASSPVVPLHTSIDMEINPVKGKNGLSSLAYMAVKDKNVLRTMSVLSI